MRTFLIAFVALVCGVPIAAYLVPMGELITIETMDEDGRAHESVLWILDGLNGVAYLRAGDPESGWLDRLILHPLVEVERDGVKQHFRATPLEDPALRSEVNRKLSEKYGMADSVVRRVRDVSGAVIVRLDPLEGEGSPSPGSRGPHASH